MKKVKKGETVALVEDEQPVPRKLTDEEWIEKLVAKGVVKRGPKAGQPLPEDWYTRPRPKAKESVLQQLLDDRHSDD